jgi:hypothetical protein
VAYALPRHNDALRGRVLGVPVLGLALLVQLVDALVVHRSHAQLRLHEVNIVRHAAQASAIGRDARGTARTTACGFFFFFFFLFLDRFINR